MNESEPVNLRVTHRFSASAERVYDAWLNPEQASKFFFATATGYIVRCEIDARVGGGFTIVDRRGDEDVAHSGTFLELTRPRRIVFDFKVEKYSSESTRVAIDISPLADGCEVTITHELPAAYANFAQRTREGWAKMLELAALVEAAAPDTCGAGLAQHAVLPAKVAPVFAALADTLELHPRLLIEDDSAGRLEGEAYRELARLYRELAQSTERAAARMTACRELAPAKHDESAYGAEHIAAFERYVEAQNALLSTLKIAAVQDQQMLDGMRSASAPADASR